MEHTWVLDTEGNGASPNEAIQLAAVEMRNYEITGRAHVWTFKPSTPITPFATRIHGIRNSDTAAWPTFAQQRDEIHSVLGRTAIVGHSVSVELDMVERGIPGWQPVKAFCTLRMARRILPAQKRHKLTILTEQYGLGDEVRRMTGRKPHDALYDATATALLIARFARDESERFDRLLSASDVMVSRRAREKSAAQRARREELKRLAKEGKW